MNHSKTRSELKLSPSSTSLLGKTRKISSELHRPLKRASSLTYRVFTPTNMVIPTDYTVENSNDNSKLLSSPISRSNSSSYVNKLTRRFKSLKKPNGYSNGYSNSSNNSNRISRSPSIINSSFTSNNFNYSPPSSPVESNLGTDHDSETDKDDMDYDNTSISSFKDSSFLITNNTTFQTSSCETSPSSNKSIPNFNFACKDFFKYDSQNNLKDLFLDIENFNDKDVYTDYSTFEFSKPQNTNPKVSHPIFEIPEILEIILRYVSYDYVDNMPNEPKLSRRPPLSYNHSLILYGEENGKKVWKRTVSNQSIYSIDKSNSNISYQNYKSTTTTTVASTSTNNKRNPNVYNCLLVNKLWNTTMLSIINETLYFENDSKFEKFTSSLLANNNDNNNTLSVKPAPYHLNLHKVKSQQSVMDLFASQILTYRLKTINFYICPSILPSLSLISKELRKLILPGCKNLNDDHLRMIISKTPKLVHLDIRACEQITDTSIYFISQKCLNLEILNIGRHKRGELISDVSIGYIARNCKNLKTFGLAGCGISDWSIWEIAINCGKNLERLSINNCWKLTNIGICNVLKDKLFENLSVLEIRNLNLNKIEEIVNWKERRLLNDNFKVLIEACENIDLLMKNYEISKLNSNDTIDNNNNNNNDLFNNLNIFRPSPSVM